MQEQLAERAGTEVHRGVADLVHAVRVPGAGRVLRRAVRHAVRQALEAQQTRPGQRRGRRPRAARRVRQTAVLRVQQGARHGQQRGRRRRRESGECGDPSPGAGASGTVLGEPRQRRAEIS